MNDDKKGMIIFAVFTAIIIIVGTILITREVTLQNVCEDKGGLFIKSRCIKVEFIK